MHKNQEHDIYNISGNYITIYMVYISILVYSY